MEVTRREKETVEAEQAQAMEKGSHVIAKMIGPDILRSIETTETAVTAMTGEIARNKMKDTDVAEMHTETGKSQKRKGGRPEGSLALTAGKIEKMIASGTAVGTETAAPGRTGVRGGPGRTTDPGRTKTGRTVDPAVAMMIVNAPKASGVNALKTERRPELAVRIAAPTTERPERTEAGETVVSKISELLRHLRAGGAVEHLESFINRGHTKNQHDRFHKPGSRTKGLPSFGNWNLSFFAFLLAGEVIGPQETSKEATYGAAIEGWISVLHDEEEDDLIRELLDSVIQGLTVVMELFEETPSQLHDAVHWKTNEPDFDRVMRHFYPREIPKGMEPKSAPKGDWYEEDAPSGRIVVSNHRGAEGRTPKWNGQRTRHGRRIGSPQTEKNRVPRKRPRRPQHPRTSKQSKMTHLLWRP